MKLKLDPKQQDRLDRFSKVLLGHHPDDTAERKAALESARNFELYLLGKSLSFSQESFRVYLLEMHRAATFSKERRDAEQGRLKLYYHAFRSESVSPVPADGTAPPIPAAPVQENPAKETPLPAAESAASLKEESSPFHDLPDESEIICPKCNFRQPRADECAKCGLVFEKWRLFEGRRGARAREALGHLRQQLESRLGPGRMEAAVESAGMNAIVLYVLAPAAIIFMFALFRSLNAGHRSAIVGAERELLTVSSDLQAIESPRQKRSRCHIEIPGAKYPPSSPFRLYAGTTLWRTPERPDSVLLALVPLDPTYSVFEPSEILVSITRTWLDKSIGTEGLLQTENVWNQKKVLESDADPTGKPRPPPKKPGEPVWTYALETREALEQPGTYEIKTIFSGWFPRPVQGMPALYTWQKRRYACEEATVEVRSFEETRDTLAALTARQTGLERVLAGLRRSEKLSRTAKFVSFAALLWICSLVLYRAFIPPEFPEEIAP